MDADVVLTEPQRTAAIVAAVHVAERLRDPASAAAAAERAAAQSQFPSFAHWMPPSVAQGNAGLAVLWAFLDRCAPAEGWDLAGKAHLEIAARAAERGVGVGNGFFSGLSGLAFAASQLSRDGMRYQRLLATLDDAVAQETMRLAAHIRMNSSSGVSVGDFDVISGLSGTGAYLLCRHEQPAIQVALANAVDVLTALIVSAQSPPAWHTPARLLVRRHRAGVVSVGEPELWSRARSAGDARLSLARSFVGFVVPAARRRDRHRGGLVGRKSSG